MSFFALLRPLYPKVYMTITNETILQADYEVVSSWRGRDGANGKGNHQLKKIIVPEQFKDDVSALCEYSRLSELTAGMKICMSLKEALNVMPRKRARLDSYKPLIKFLKDEMGVSLIITSQKSKQYEE